MVADSKELSTIVAFVLQFLLVQVCKLAIGGPVVVAKVNAAFSDCN